MEFKMDPFNLLTSASIGLGLTPALTAGVFAVTGGSIGLTVINLMNGKPVTAVKTAVGGSAFTAVLWAFGQVSGALGVI